MTLTHIFTPLFAALFCALLLAVAVIDARTQRIPDALNAALAAAGLAFAVYRGEVWSAGLGLVAGYALIWGVNRLYRARRGRDGVGMGDAKLLAALGAWVGWFGAPFVVVIGSSLALVMLAARRLQGQDVTATMRIAFGPYLAAGGAVVFAVQRFTGL